MQRLQQDPIALQSLQQGPHALQSRWLWPWRPDARENFVIGVVFDRILTENSFEICSAERVQALCRHSLDDSAVTGDTQIYFLEATRPPAPVA